MIDYGMKREYGWYWTDTDGVDSRIIEFFWINDKKQSNSVFLSSTKYKKLYDTLWPELENFKELQWHITTLGCGYGMIPDCIVELADNEEMYREKYGDVVSVKNHLDISLEYIPKLYCSSKGCSPVKEEIDEDDEEYLEVDHCYWVMAMLPNGEVDFTGGNHNKLQTVKDFVDEWHC